MRPDANAEESELLVEGAGRIVVAAVLQRHRRHLLSETNLHGREQQERARALAPKRLTYRYCHHVRLVDHQPNADNADYQAAGRRRADLRRKQPPHHSTDQESRGDSFARVRFALPALFDEHEIARQPVFQSRDCTLSAATSRERIPARCP